MEKQPVDFHLLPGISGHIGRARAKAFMRLANMGYEVITYVDDDDRVYGVDSFSACLAALDANPTAAVAYPMEAQIDTNEKIVFNPGIDYYTTRQGTIEETAVCHHLAHFRTQMAMPFVPVMEKYACIPEDFLRMKLWLRYPFAFVPVLGYGWRRYQNSSIVNGRDGLLPLNAGNKDMATINRIRRVLSARHANAVD